jgi:hypothetical protein
MFSRKFFFLILKELVINKLYSRFCKDSGGGVLTSVICEAEDSSYGEKPALKTRQ